MTPLDCGGKPLDLTRPCIMGVLNITPDSFSDGGQYFAPELALEQAFRMVEQGADIIDVGGESTRPGALAVSLEEETRRVIPVLETLAAKLDVPVSIDTSKPELMRAAAAAGAGMINDVMALREPGAVQAAADTGLPVCLMHMQGRPRTMQERPLYDDVVREVIDFLAQRVVACEQAGIARSRLLVDPGFGFGKSLEHNLSLLKHLGRMQQLELPVLVGLSRKSMLGALTARAVGDRVYAGIAGAVLAVQAGARIVRVHDVAATADALKLTHAVMAAR